MLLKIGSKGDDVSKIQEKLGINPTTGNFGPITEAKVKEYQTLKGIEVDGIVGDDTWKLLFGDNNTFSGSPFKIEKLKGIIPESIILQIPDTAKSLN